MPAYDALVQEFETGDVLFGLSDDLETAKAALNDAYGDGATFWNAFSRAGRDKNDKARRITKSTDVFLQADLTNAVANPGVLGDRIKAAIPAVKAAQAPGAALTARPMASAYDPARVPQKLQSETQRGIDFAAFLEGHEKFDPKLMGGTLRADGTFAPLGAKESDRQWIAQSRKAAFMQYLIGELDAGRPLHLKGGVTRPPRLKGANRRFIESLWDQIDWSRYDMWGFLHESHLANVVNYKIWKRTSKAGLEFQTTVRERMVHFLLDKFMAGDGMTSVVDKGGAHGKSITAGELRWLFRNWPNPKVQANVKFWTIHGEQSPPWEMPKYQALWAGYQPKGQRNVENSRALAASLQVYDEPNI